MMFEKDRIDKIPSITNEKIEFFIEVAQLVILVVDYYTIDND